MVAVVAGVVADEVPKAGLEVGTCHVRKREVVVVDLFQQLGAVSAGGSGVVAEVEQGEEQLPFGVQRHAQAA